MRARTQARRAGGRGDRARRGAGHPRPHRAHPAGRPGRRRDLRRPAPDPRQRAPAAAHASGPPSSASRSTALVGVLAVRRPGRDPGRDRAVGGGPVRPRRPAAGVRPGARPRTRRPARHQGLPGRAADPGAAGLPLRRAAVLRERPRLPGPRPGRGGRADGAGGVAPAQRRGDRGAGHDRGRRDAPAGRATWRSATSCSRWPGSSRSCGAQLVRGELMDIIDEERIYPTLPVAVEAFESWRDRR